MENSWDWLKQSGGKALPYVKKAAKRSPWAIPSAIAGELFSDDTGGWRDYVGNILTYGGTGAAIGSAFGPIGAGVGAGIGAGIGAGLEYADDDTGGAVAPAGSAVPLGPAPTTSALTPEEIRERYLKYFGDVSDGGAGAVSGLNAAEAAAMRDYWASLRQYGANRAQAMQDMFAGTAAARARAGAATQRSGTDLAADIENLYSRLGSQVGQPTMAPGSPTAGLAPVSGEQAVAPQVIESRGASLADFLESATGAEARNLYDIAAAQALQGASMSQGFMDMLYMAEQQAIQDQRNRAAARAAQAASAQAAARDQQNRELGALLLQTDLENLQRERETSGMTEAAQLVLGNMRVTNPDRYEQMVDVVGNLYTDPSTGAPLTPEGLATLRPDLAAALFGGNT